MVSGMSIFLPYFVRCYLFNEMIIFALHNEQQISRGGVLIYEKKASNIADTLCDSAGNLHVDRLQ